MDNQYDKSRKVLESIVANINKAIIGKKETVELVILAMASSGHVLIEDIPGVGKTSLVSALARSVDCSFKRIQFTPDILPSDITGFSVYNPKTGDFVFQPGAVMSNFVLADEINRTSPKTQASLLEIMEENQVTVDAHTYKLEQPFMVLATQNPIEYLGTYPLPEAEIDRFIVRVSLGYPEYNDELRILSMKAADKSISPVAAASDVVEVRSAVSGIYVDDLVKRYILDIVKASRNHKEISLGVSPRGSIALCRICCARALYCGRDYVLPDDVKYLAPFVLSHRLVLTREAKVAGRTQLEIVNELLESVPLPKEQKVNHV